MNMVEIAGKFYQEDYNCAESLIRAANEYYGMGIDPDTLRVSAAFGGGMCVGGTCGAVSGAMMALGYLFVSDRAHEGDEQIKQIGAAFMEKFVELHDTTVCETLKDHHHNEEDGCIKVVELAAALLEEIVDQYEELKVAKN